MSYGPFEKWQAGRDLNHRHLPPEGSVLPLNYRPMAGKPGIEPGTGGTKIHCYAG